MPKNLRKPLRSAKTYVFFKNLRIGSLHLHPYVTRETKVPQNATIKEVKVLIGNHFQVNDTELYVCDTWKSNIHFEYRLKDLIKEIDFNDVDLFVYHSGTPIHRLMTQNQSKKQAVVCVFEFIEHEAKDLHSVQQILLGYPLVFTLENRAHVIADIEDGIWKMVKSFVRDEKREHAVIQAFWGYNGQMVIDKSKQTASNTFIPDNCKQHLKFVVQFNNKNNFVNDKELIVNHTILISW